MTHYACRTIGCIAAVVLIAAGWISPALATPLDDYVAEPDEAYTWSLKHTIPGTGYEGHVLVMVSQTWRSREEVDRRHWIHWVILIVPTTVTSDTAFLMIDGGNNGGDPPESVDDTLAGIAVASNTVITQVKMVPSQPLTFDDETESRREDALIAYSWDKFLTTGDVTWPAQLPMAKTVVRGMDTIQAYLADPNYVDPPIGINQFVVGGGSKRGWTTWLTAAVDDRVIAIMPTVIDVLNVETSFEHHHNSYGFWTPAVHDYVEMGIMDWMGTQELIDLMDIVDPYVYRDRFTMPKFLINATGDQFFHPESSQFYWDDLIGEKHLRYVPNTDHAFTGAEVDVASCSLAYYRAILNGTPLPQFSWTLEDDGSIRVETVDTPTAVRLWQASNPTARDFRLETIGAAWTSSDLTDQGGGVYVGEVPEPLTGWTAFLVELEFDSGDPTAPYTFSTQVRVLPEPAILGLDVVNEPWGSVEVDPNLPSYYDPNTAVTLTAVPIEGRGFKHWLIDDPNHPGDANHAAMDANNPITLLMDDDRNVTAVFECGSGVGQALPLLAVAAVLFGLAARFMRRRN